MPKMEFKERVDISGFAKDMKKLRNKEWPKAIASTFSDIAIYSQGETQDHTRREFDLHTEYIPRGIRAVPSTDAQRRRAVKSLAKYYDMFAAVYLRGSVDPAKSLGFMAQHEEGYKRTPNSSWASLGGEQYLAQPGPKKFHNEGKVKTKRGRTRKRFKPGEMLKKFRAAGSEYQPGKKTTITRSFKGRRKPGTGKVPGSWFVIQPATSKVPAIARRSEKVRKKGSSDSKNKGNLEIMWWLTKEQDIKDDYRFHRTVMSAVRARYPIVAKRMGSKVRL